MKKTFPLKVSGHADARVVEAIKNDVRKYLKRERKKALPTDFDRWEFSCRLGASQDAAEAKSVDEVIEGIDAVAVSGADTVYVEILAVPGKRAPRPDL